MDKSLWGGGDDLEEISSGERWYNHVKCPDSKTAISGQSVGLVGFRCDEGVRRNNGRPGAADGPVVFRQQLANVAWQAGDLSVVDFGDICAADEELALSQEKLALQIAKILPKVDRLLVVGGGHETAVGSFRGLQTVLGEKATIGIVNLDAHFDLRRPSQRGASSGTPFFQIQNLVGAKNFHYFCMGIATESNTRSLFNRADKWGVRYYLDTELASIDPARVKADLQAFVEPLDALYLTIDMDVLPHYQAPGVSAPAVRGVSLSVIEMIIDQVVGVAHKCNFGLPLVEIVELNPCFDQHGISARTAAVLADRMLKSSKCSTGLKRPTIYNSNQGNRKYEKNI
ncbi:MAG: formimidoylglutamase [Sneathiella sp.]